MIAFSSRWKCWTQKCSASSYGSFVSSCPSDVLEKHEPDRSASGIVSQVSDHKLPNTYDQVTDKTDKRVSGSAISTSSRFRPWDCDLIWHSLTHGKAVPIFSRGLNEWIFWVWGQKEKDRLAIVRPNAMIYTFDELTTLTKSAVTHEGLKKLHEAKRILGGKFIDKMG